MCVCVFIRYIEFLFVLKTFLQGINIGQENLRQRPGVWRLTTRLGSHPSSHAEKDSHLHSLSLTQWAVIGIHRRVKASYYSCGSVMYAATIMALHHLFLTFYEIEKKKNTEEKQKPSTQAGSRESYWVHRWRFFEVYLFEILEGCSPFFGCVARRWVGNNLRGPQGSLKDGHRLVLSPFHFAPPISSSVQLQTLTLCCLFAAQTLRQPQTHCLPSFVVTWMNADDLVSLHKSIRVCRCAQLIVMKATDNFPVISLRECQIVPMPVALWYVIVLSLQTNICIKRVTSGFLLHPINQLKQIWLSVLQYHHSEYLLVW